MRALILALIVAPPALACAGAAHAAADAPLLLAQADPAAGDDGLSGAAPDGVAPGTGAPATVPGRPATLSPAIEAELRGQRTPFARPLQPAAPVTPQGPQGPNALGRSPGFTGPAGPQGPAGLPR